MQKYQYPISLYYILGRRLCRNKGWQLTYYLYWDDWSIIQVSINSPNGLSWSSTKNRCCSPIAASVFTHQPGGALKELRQPAPILYSLKVLLMSLKRVPNEFEDESIRDLAGNSQSCSAKNLWCRWCFPKGTSSQTMNGIRVLKPWSLTPR